MRKPYADDWQPIPDSDLMYSKSKKMFWNTTKEDVGDAAYAEWAGWIGPGATLRKMIKEDEDGT